MKTKITFLIAFVFLGLCANAQFTQQGSKLVGTGAVGGARKGNSVSISSDGNTAIVGGYYDNTGVGAAWVFIRTSGVWTQQGSKLIGTGATGNAYQGVSVALSSDGNTAIIGGNQDNSGRGAVWIFTRTAGVWTQEGSKLVGTGYVGGPQQGWSVSLSSDGNTAFVGGHGDNGGVGAAWVFTRTAGVWTQLGNKLIGTGSIGAAEQGSSVFISSDGQTALVGGWNDNTSAGATWVYTLIAGVWTQQGNKLVGTGGDASSEQGYSVSLSSDGNTAMAGGLYDISGRGATWVFTRTGGVWTQQGNKLVGTGYVGSGTQQGYSVTLSSDGNTVIEGGNNDNSGRGAIWVFTRTAGVWTQQGTKLVGTGYVGGSQQGSSVSISSDGQTAIVGGGGDNTNAGAVWIYTNPCATSTIPVVTANSDTTFCQGGSVMLTASSATSYLWSNSATTQSINVSFSGNYSVIVTDGSGCSGTSLPKIVTVNPTYSQNVSASICPGDTYTFPDATTSTTATVHTSHLSSVNTCDSAIVTTLSINPTYSQNVSASVCQGNTYTFPDATTSTIATVHTSHLNTIHTCDSAITTTLTINLTYSQSVPASICNGDTYTFPDGTTATTATVHTSHLSSINTCDSAIVTTLSINPTYSQNVSANICQGDTYTFPDATTSTTATVHTSHLSSVNTCDSAIVTTLSINPTYSQNVSASICPGDTYTFPDATTSTTAVIHTSHLSTIHSCDSAIVTTLTVNPTYSQNVSASICQGDTYTFPDATTSTTATVHTSHLNTINSCDSAIVTTLSINPIYSQNVSASICQGDTYTFPDATTSTTATVHTSHLSTIHSCDSAIVTTLSINPTYSQNVSASICQGNTYTFPDATTSTTATVHTSHLSSVNTCDSAIVTTLSINPTYSQNVSASICPGDTYTFPDATTSTIATVHTSHLNTINSCDSSIVTTLTVNSVDVSVSMVSATLTSNASAASYQWLNCATMNPIIGETNQSYTATSNGNYAVIVTQNTCTDTSICYNIFSVGINENSLETKVTIYPNPANNSLNIGLTKYMENEQLIIIDFLGREIYKEGIKSINTVVDVSHWSEGIYSYQIKNDKESLNGKFEVKR